MTDKEVAGIVRQQIGDNWSQPNRHEVNLARSLVSPTTIHVIARHVEDGRVRDEVIRVWLVFEERIVERNGYKIVFDENARRFGLVSPESPSDAAPILCGWYGDFMTTFVAM
jgi:hypothetical protein